MEVGGEGDRVHKPQLLKRKESRTGIEPRSFRLTARPNRLSEPVLDDDGLVSTEGREK